ncbi:MULTISPECIES: ribonuclease catalytic domain-containing protein [Prochlorococcus]|uniref:Exoribonuclease R/ribonuclease II n=1 Tax=Prochlorococcus marinus (strain SARG / CCMP1375 / SS120) TaxID=167539 RepID=Q7VBX3_PROMA|nr:MULTISPECIES: ribonuclease catalytic domain-containing protein [Prochlorococcus]AAQ00014.1 Exoribonuclease R/ribonuclease II [Prochlorococcus marinus subsp. marinus str. CCMP1375]KGG13809.1 Exoribonuclease II [Prochlorococcus marinus str. LG]KGG18944.1 Exoribonuclease II [Prochlorococcus marinus str. SS2]KGG23518.1 Exoribonuclease II [Prochlorococcus marinus str. SS35]KGG32246.1 Exoribonuclease II [Prochlorococcus marinus str. SS51]
MVHKRAFTRKCLIESKSILGRDIISNKDHHKYKDITNLKTYTIDDPNTIEIDDAISLEKRGDKCFLWIHIANPAETISLNSALAQEAMIRSSTIYLAESISYMFPKELIREKISLVQGKESLAISLKLELSDKGDINSFSIERTKIKPDYKLSYEEANEILDYQPKEETELIIFYNLINQHYNNRIKQGAIIIEESEGIIFKKDNYYQHKIRKMSPSRRLISESMIIYGELIAEYCFSKKIVIFYRNQSPATLVDIKKLKFFNNNHVKNYILKSSLGKSNIEIKPKKHYSLALNKYSQATSPLRRYCDFINQHQLLSYFNNKKQLSEVEMLSILDKVKLSQTQNIQLTRANKRNSILSYLEHTKKKKWNVIFMRWMVKKEKLALLYFSDIYLDIVCSLNGYDQDLLGYEFIIHLDQLDSGLDIIKVTAINYN